MISKVRSNFCSPSLKIYKLKGVAPAESWFVISLYLLNQASYQSPSSSAPYYLFPQKNFEGPLSAVLHKLASDAVHGALDALLDQRPVRAPLSELVDLLGPKDAAKAVAVRDDSREFLGMRSPIDEIDLGQLT